MTAPTGLVRGDEAVTVDDPGEGADATLVAAKAYADAASTNEANLRTAAAALTVAPTFNGKKLSGVADGSASTDAATRGQMDAADAATLSSANTTAATLASAAQAAAQASSTPTPGSVVDASVVVSPTPFRGTLALSPLGGGSDDWPAFNLVLAAAAVLALAGSIFTCLTAGAAIPSNTTIIGQASTKLKSTNTGNSFFDAIFTAQASPANGLQSGTVNTDVVVNSKTIIVSIAAKPTVGNYLLVQHGTCQALYKVIAATGASTPFTVTVDRPIVWPFVHTGTPDTVIEYTSAPERSVVDMRGGRLSGTGKQAVELAHAKQYSFRDLHYVNDDGTLTGSPFGYDVACQECVLEDFTSDHTGASASVYFQSNERSIVRRGECRNGGGAIALFDCYSCGIEDVWSVDTTGASGTSTFQVTRISASGFGCTDCWITGGGSVGCVGTVVDIQYSARTKVSNFSILGGTNGFSVLNSNGTRFVSISALNVTNIGAIVDTGCDGTTIDGFECSGSATALSVKSGSTNTTASKLRFSTCTGSQILAAADLTVIGLTSVTATGDGTTTIGASAGNFTLRDSHASSTLLNGSIVQVSGASTVARITGVRFDMTSGANQTGVYCTAGTTHLTDCVFNGIASSLPFDATGASTVVYIHGGNKFDGATINAVPSIRNGATAYMDPQPGAVSLGIANANATLAWAQVMSAQLTLTGIALTANRTITFPKIVGYVWLVLNATVAGAFSVVCSTGSGSTVSIVSTGTTFARVMWDGTNMVQV